MVRAKLKCESVLDTGAQREVVLRPVTCNSEVNKEWSKWTPNGEIRLTITNPAAFNQFRAGVEYFATFDEVAGSVG